MEGAHLTLHGLEEERDDLKDLERAINRKTGGKTKMHTVISDLRKEDACQQLVQKHLDFHGGKLDSLYVLTTNMVDAS